MTVRAAPMTGTVRCLQSDGWRMATTIHQEFARHRLQKDWLSCDASLEPLFQRILSEDARMLYV